MIQLGEHIWNDSTDEYGSVAFFYLNKERSYSCKIIMDDWSVEIGKKMIIASTAKTLSAEQLHKQAYLICEKVLDLYAMERREYFSIINGAWKYILYYWENGVMVIEIHDINYFPVCVTSEVTPRPDEGQTQISMSISFGDEPISDASVQEYKAKRWNPVFRYYRFAILSDNFYDAYRWMYLTFEQLLQMVEPIKRNEDGKICEKEKAWLQRALKALEARFAVFVNLYGKRDSQALIEQFFKEQYNETRCRLFHAKGWVIVPNDEVTQKQLQQRYEELKQLCDSILMAYGVLKMPYGVMTYQGFWATMKQTGQETKGFFSNQTIDAILAANDVLPENTAIIESVVTKEFRPGTVEVFYEYDCENADGNQRYITYGLATQGCAAVIVPLPEELSFDGPARVEIHQMVQMVNKGESVCN